MTGWDVPAKHGLGGETGRGSNQALQAHRFTSYDRDANSGDDAMMRRYQSSSSRFNQPDPYAGSYNLTDPQSLNRYAYTQNDPVNYVDPSGLNLAGNICSWNWTWRADGEGGWEQHGRFACEINYQAGVGGGSGSGFRRSGPAASSATNESCDRSRAAVEKAASVVTSKIPGARISEQDGWPIINFSGVFHETVKQLTAAGFYSGVRAFNPLGHAGGMEFRTSGSPGFHFKVVYPRQTAVPVAPNSPEFKPVEIKGPAVATDLHIDCNNPVGSGVGGVVKHSIDVAKELIGW